MPRISHDLRRRANRRAHQLAHRLAQAAYERFRAALVADLAEGLPAQAIDDWRPAELVSKK